MSANRKHKLLLGFGESMIVLRAEGTPGIISHFMFGIEG
jgi:hypothetical protein